MAAPVSAMPPERAVSEEDLCELAEWLPPTARDLIEALGRAPALALLRELPGAQLVIPLREAANAAGAQHWAELAEIVGAGVMPVLCSRWGGAPLDVPTCAELLLEKRSRWIRSRFNYLTLVHSPRLSGHTAARVINIALSRARWPLTLREVQKVVNGVPKQAPRPRAPPRGAGAS